MFAKDLCIVTLFENRDFTSLAAYEYACICVMYG